MCAIHGFRENRTFRVFYVKCYAAHLDECFPVNAKMVERWFSRSIEWGCRRKLCCSVKSEVVILVLTVVTMSTFSCAEVKADELPGGRSQRGRDLCGDHNNCVLLERRNCATYVERSRFVAICSPVILIASSVSRIAQ